MPKSKFVFAFLTFCLTGTSAYADWQDTSKINKWFDDQKGKKYEMEKAGPQQNAPGKMQVPGAFQVPGKLQIPRGIKAIKQTEATKCEHRFVVGADALFDFDKAFLNPRAEETLKVWGPLILKDGKHPISIEGHTDGIGGVDYNQQLSEKRAHAVEFWLTDHKFLLTTASVSGYGKNRPIAPNTHADGSDNPAGRQLNRRVEIVVDRCKTVPPVAATPPATAPAVVPTATPSAAATPPTPSDAATPAATTPAPGPGSSHETTPAATTPPATTPAPGASSSDAITPAPTTPADSKP